MKNYTKFTIYYEPAKINHEHVESATLAFSRLNTQDDTYKQKFVLEQKSKDGTRIEEYKMKEFHVGVHALLENIKNNIDFDKSYPAAIHDKAHEYFYISFGDKFIETSNRDSIQSILDAFQFDKLLSISHEHYKSIKDMYEYITLFEILNKKTMNLSAERMITLANIFKTKNPYQIFQSMGWLEKFLDDMKNEQKL